MILGAPEWVKVYCFEAKFFARLQTERSVT